MRRIVFGDDKNAARFLVQPMNDARAFLAADAGKIFAMGEERVDQRVFLMAGARVNHEPGRLVEDEKIVVFKKNFEVHRFRLRFDLRGFGFAHFNDCTRSHGIARPRRFSIDGHELFANQRLKSGPGKGGERLDEKAIEPLAGIRAFDFELGHG